MATYPDGPAPTSGAVAVPARPPALEPGRSAGTWFAATVVVAVLGGIAVFVLIRTGALPFLPTLLSAVALVVVVLLGLRAATRRMLLEIRHGYTTFAPTYAGVGALTPRVLRGRGGWVPWDHRGLWNLTTKGAVRSTPDAAVALPGFYPSPVHPGALELWTGRVWTGVLEG